MELRSKPGAVLQVSVQRVSNRAPTANAGSDQSVLVGAAVQLDGTASTDADGDALSYHWSIAARTTESLAELTDPTSPTPSLVLDRAGDYRVQLVVSDRFVSSAADEVVVSTVNSAPAANAGPDQSGFVGSTVQLDGSASHDVDCDFLSYYWSLSVRPEGSQATLSAANSANPTLFLDQPGTYAAELVVGDGLVYSAPDTVVVTTQNSRPVADAGPDQTVQTGRAVTLDGSASHDADHDALSYRWSLTSVPAGSQAALADPLGVQSRLIPDLAGLYVAQLIVDDGQVDSAPDTIKIDAIPPANHPPRITSAPVTTATAGQVYQYAVKAQDDDGDLLSYSLPLAPQGMDIGGNGLISWTPQASGSVTVTVRVSDQRGGIAEQSYTLEVAPNSNGGLPPDPAQIAPPLDPTAATPLWEASRFLYSGANPIQTGADPSKFDTLHLAVVRGQVLDRSNQPLSGVIVTVQGHPEFGQTQSRLDGWFDLAVNGGGIVTFNYQKPGYLPVQRQVKTPWLDYAFADTVVLIPLDGLVTAIDLANPPSAIQVAQGSPSLDADGARQASVFFPAGTAASLVMPDGSSQPLTSLHVRATEYTVGENGPKAMPGPLPPTSGYTYAVELSADEAIGAGAKSVQFSQPVPVYIDNFLNFPVGETVPVGWYDRDKAAWIPANNGRVVKILGIANGLAQVDVKGSGLAATGSELAALQITDAERAQLALQYAPGKSLWRVALSHFTPWDCNWPYGPPPDAIPPPTEPPKKKPPENPCDKAGCTLGMETRTLGQDVPIPGTPYSFHYRSDRVPGRKENYRIDIPVTTSNPPASLKDVDVVVDIAGRRFSQTFSPQPDQTYTFEWDGLDGYGRPLATATATVTVKYSYGAVYYAASSEFEQSFALATGGDTSGKIVVIGERESQTIAIQSEWTSVLGGAGSYLSGAELGAWTLNMQHFYDARASTLFLGSGLARRINEAGEIIETVAGNGFGGFLGDGGLATAARLYSPGGVALGSDGSLYISDTRNHRVRRVAPDGIITTVVGNGTAGFGGDGGLATEARLLEPEGLAMNPDGSLYIADSGNNRIRRVGPDGLITTVVGDGNSDCFADGVPATTTCLRDPKSIAVSSNGTLYIADTANNRIRSVGPEGIITTVAGREIYYCDQDGMPATETCLHQPDDVAVGANGVLYISDSGHNKVRRVELNGVITTVAGNGAYKCFEDNVPATETCLPNVGSVAVGPDGAVYVSDYYYQRVRRIGLDGFISTVAGNGIFDGEVHGGYSGDGGLATAAQLSDPVDIAIGVEGSLYIADTGNHRIRRVGSVLSTSFNHFVIPSEDGALLYRFDYTGRHLETLDALTGQPVYTFGYDTEGRLSSITDRDGDITRIERDGAGNPTAIVSADGQRTALGLDANGYLASIAEPAGGVHRMSYTADGLMTTYSNPRGFGETYHYDVGGAFVQNLEANGGGTTLARTERPNGYTVTATSGEGLVSSYTTDTPLIGGLERLLVAPDGTQTQISEKPTGETVTTSADGTVSTTLKVPDPRFGMLAAYVQSTSVKTPSGLTWTASASRSAPLADATNLFSFTSLNYTTTVNGNTFREVYDPTATTWTATSPLGRTATTQVNNKNRPVLKQTPGLLPLSLAYDPRGRLKEATAGTGPDTRTTTYTYDAQGYLASITDALERQVQYQYDPNGRVTRQILPDSREILYQYDPNGNLTALTPPGRPSHGFDFDAIDQPESYIPPTVPGILDPVTHYAYDKDKRPTTITRPDGQEVQFHYGPATGHLDSLTTPSGNYAYSYNAAGRIQTVTAPQGGQLTYIYDGSLPLIEAWTGQVAGQTVTTYDHFFRPKTQSIDNANGITFAFDADGLLIQSGSLTLTRDPQNGLLTQTSLGSVITSQSYNGFGEISGYEATVGASSLAHWTYQRDPLGRLTQKTETIEGGTAVYDYAYDPAGRLIEVKQNGTLQASYGYDINGNRTQINGQTVATYDDQDRLTTFDPSPSGSGAGVRGYSYTDNGELKTVSDSSGTTQYRYDVLGNLTHLTLPDGTQLDYLIDGKNRRIGKKVNGTLVQGFLYQDQIKPIAELDGSNQIVARFVYGDKSNAPAYLVKNGNTYRIVSDHLGSPRLVVNTQDGTVAQQMEYDAWGNVIFDSNPGFQPFGFAGGIYDRDTRLTRFGARDYEAETGRWTAKDPIRFAGGETDLYAYVGNNPVNAIDPLGLIKLPADPSGLPPNWNPVPSHRDPNGERWTNGTDVLDFHKGRPGMPGWRGKDHWHHNGGDDHLKPGDQCPTSDDPPVDTPDQNFQVEPPPPWWWVIPFLIPFPGNPLYGGF